MTSPANHQRRLSGSEALCTAMSTRKTQKATERTPIDEAELTTQLHTYGLVRTIADLDCIRSDKSYSALLETLAIILNGPDAPPIDLYLEEALGDLKEFKFFSVQHVLCDLIPLLNVDQGVLLAFVTRLVDAGGDDLTAGDPSTAFGEWTKQDATRAVKVYKAARCGDSFALRHLSIVLKMHEDISESLVFVQSDERKAKLSAISALGSMDLGERYEEVLGTLLQEASSDDEEIALHSLKTAYRAASARRSFLPTGFDEQLERVFHTRSPFAIHLAADLLCLYRGSLTEKAINLCFDAVSDVDPNSKGTISHIDLAAAQLVDNGCTEKVVRLLNKLLDRAEGQVTLDAFDNTYYALQKAGLDVLGSAVVYWLLNGGTYTRNCLANKVCSVGQDNPPFSVPAAYLPPESSDQLFLCRKAIGWFFMDPLAAIVIPLAVLRNGSPDIAKEVLELIYNPLLLSYSGKLKDYLVRYMENDDVNGSGLAELLARKKAFQDAMTGIERLVELHPNEMQREIDYLQRTEQTKRSMEEASRKSILRELFNEQYILYGNRFLTQIRINGEETNLVEHEMNSFSISSELPLLDIVDPVGLDYQLSYFKFEDRERR